MASTTDGESDLTVSSDLEVVGDQVEVVCDQVELVDAPGSVAGPRVPAPRGASATSGPPSADGSFDSLDGLALVGHPDPDRIVRPGGLARRIVGSHRVQLGVGFSLIAALTVTGAVVARLDAVTPAAPAGRAAVASPDVDADAPAGAPDRAPTLEDLTTGLLAAPSWTGTASYAATGSDGARATITLVRQGSSARVDVATASGRASLLTTPAGWVACSTAASSQCLLVAAPGGDVPPAFDPGTVALVTTTLPAMTRPGSGLTLTDPLPAAPGQDQAACGRVGDGAGRGAPVWDSETSSVQGYKGAAADLGAGTVTLPQGEVCVTTAGLLRRAVFAGGELDLLSAAGEVDPARFVPPSAPLPLP